MAKKEPDYETSNIYISHDSGENGRAAFKSKFKSRFGKSNRYSLFMRLEKEERKGE